VLAGESDVDQPPAKPSTIPPPSGSNYYASGDAIAAELLGAAAETTDADRTVEETPEEVETVEPEPTESETGEPEAIDAEPLDEPDEPLEPDSGIVPPASLEEAEPYVPDEGDLHPRTVDDSGSRSSNIDTSILDEGSGVEDAAALEPPVPARGEPRTSNPPAVAPLPLGRPRAAPVQPFELGRPEARRVLPVDLDDSPAQPEEEFISEWFKQKK